MEEAGRPGGQRRSIMTAVAVSVGGLALWHGHPARRCPTLCMHQAVAAPSASFIAITSVRPCLLRTREMGWRGGVGVPNLPYSDSWSQSRTSVKDAHPWKLYTPPGTHVRHQCGNVVYVCHSIRRTDRHNAERPLTLKPTLHLYDLLWTCCWCAVLDLVFVQNGERRQFG